MHTKRTIVAVSFSVILVIGFSTEAFGQFKFQSRQSHSDRQQHGRSGGQEFARSRSGQQTDKGVKARHVAKQPNRKEEIRPKNQALVDPRLTLRLQRQLELDAARRAQRRAAPTFGSSAFGPGRGQGPQSFNVAGTNGAAPAGSTRIPSQGQSANSIIASSSRPIRIQSPFASFADDNEHSANERFVESETSSKAAISPVSSRN